MSGAWPLDFSLTGILCAPIRGSAPAALTMSAPPPPSDLRRQLSDEGRRLLLSGLADSKDAEADAKHAAGSGHARRAPASTGTRTSARRRSSSRVRTASSSKVTSGGSRGVGGGRGGAGTRGGRSGAAGKKVAEEDDFSTAGVAVVTCIDGPILFSAPHGLRVWRGGKAVGERLRIHKREHFSTEIALRLAAEVGKLGVQPSFVLWNCVTARKADKTNLDPNYLIPSQFDRSPWHHALWAYIEHNRGVPLLHIDVHGKKDRKDNLDLDVGMDPLIEFWSDDSEKTALQEAVCDGFRAAMRGMPSQRRGMKFTVEDDPYLGGFWGDETTTFSHASVLRGVPAFQLEIPMTMRLKLMSDDSFCKRFAEAIVGAYNTVIVPRGMGLEAHIPTDRPERVPFGLVEGVPTVAIIEQYLAACKRIHAASSEPVI